MPLTPLLRSLDEWHEWLASTKGDGEGYVELGIGDALLMFSFRGSVAVVHWFPQPEQCFLLLGDGVVDDGQALQFPVEDDECRFSGAFVSSLDRAQHVAGEVLRAGSTEGIGRWELL